MKKLNKTTDISKYNKGGILTKPFLDLKYLKNEVNNIYNQKVAFQKDITMLNCLCSFIHRNIAPAKNKKDKKVYKFKRSAEQIWQSGFAVGCSDFAILFATFARQLGFACTILHTAEYNWVKQLFYNGDSKAHKGHFFCECFYNGEWILVDPTKKRIIQNYDVQIVHLPYKLGGADKFIPFLREVELKYGIDIQAYNKMMDEYVVKQCKNVSFSLDT